MASVKEAATRYFDLLYAPDGSMGEVDEARLALEDAVGYERPEGGPDPMLVGPPVLRREADRDPKVQRELDEQAKK